MAETNKPGLQPKSGPPADPQQSVDVKPDDFQRLKDEQAAATSASGSTSGASGPFAGPAPVPGAHVPTSQARADGRVQEWLTAEEKEALDQLRVKGQLKKRPVVVVGDVDVRRGNTVHADGSTSPRIVRIPNGKLLSETDFTEEEVKSLIRSKALRRATLDELEAAERRTAQEKASDDALAAQLKDLGDKPKKPAKDMSSEFFSDTGAPMKRPAGAAR